MGDHLTDNKELLLDTELIPEQDFHKKLKAIFAVPKRELDEHIATHPDTPQKRGRKPKATNE